MTDSATAERVLSDIADYRSARSASLNAKLRALPKAYVESIRLYQEPMLQWTLIHHLYRTALQAAKSSNDDIAHQRLASWLPDAARAGTSVEQFPAVVDKAHTIAVRIGADEAPLNVLDPLAIDHGASIEGSSAVAGSIAVLEHIGYGSIVRNATGAVVLMKRIDFGAEANSWTTTALPGTVYLDWYPNPEILAKEVLHESVHLWLNDAIEARRLTFAPEELYYSPWKERKRSSYAMFHSVAAFSHITNYLAKLHGTTADPMVREYCQIRVDQERDRLSSAYEAIQRTLGAVGDQEIADLIRCEYAEALDGSRPQG
ncbi:aKG-HExxH-type peptide beta-hydroxylase [Kitasatospora kifunensis]|uniref:HEXXH motif domain-containing protein n=1 Tax=Kitasatospora kifunensis TaxID=58351 RepID=A0A7W7VYP8_KITKI|nr:HEXXH motif-containing putative peptide modification protein [Kitasatospora kifunensis]MBB4926924.1 hypothetical protein [Kitasatospora kifunensis]